MAAFGHRNTKENSQAGKGAGGIEIPEDMRRNRLAAQPVTSAVGRSLADLQQIVLRVFTPLLQAKIQKGAGRTSKVEPLRRFWDSFFDAQNKAYAVRWGQRSMPTATRTHASPARERFRQALGTKERAAAARWIFRGAREDAKHNRRSFVTKTKERARDFFDAAAAKTGALAEKAIPLRLLIALEAARAKKAKFKMPKVPGLKMSAEGMSAFGLARLKPSRLGQGVKEKAAAARQAVKRSLTRPATPKIDGAKLYAEGTGGTGAEKDNAALLHAAQRVAKKTGVSARVLLNEMKQPRFWASLAGGAGTKMAIGATAKFALASAAFTVPGVAIAMTLGAGFGAYNFWKNNREDLRNRKQLTPEKKKAVMLRGVSNVAFAAGMGWVGYSLVAPALSEAADKVGAYLSGGTPALPTDAVDSFRGPLPPHSGTPEIPAAPQGGGAPVAAGTHHGGAPHHGGGRPHHGGGKVHHGGGGVKSTPVTALPPEDIVPAPEAQPDMTPQNATPVVPPVGGETPPVQDVAQDMSQVVCRHAVDTPNPFGGEQTCTFPDGTAASVHNYNVNLDNLDGRTLHAPVAEVQTQAVPVDSAPGNAAVSSADTPQVEARRPGGGMLSSKAPVLAK